MTNPYPYKLRISVVKFVQEGNTHRAAAERFDVSTTFVSSLMRRYRETGSVAPKRKPNFELFDKFVPNRKVGELTPEFRSAVDSARKHLDATYDGRGCWDLKVIAQRGSKDLRRVVLRAQNLKTDYTLALKINVDQDVNHKEFTALKEMHAETRDSVTPVFICEDNRFFLLEWVTGPELSNLVSGEDRSALLKRAGRWLADLQARTRGRPATLAAKIVTRLPHYFDDILGAEIARNLRARTTAIKLDEFSTAMIHGDYSVRNIFDSGDRLIVFDRKYDGYGPVVYDALFFLSQLEEQRDLAASNGEPWSGDADADRRDFFEGYGPMPIQDVAVFDILEDLVVAKRWHRRHQDYGETVLNRQMENCGLLTTDIVRKRPGRLVLKEDGATEWSHTPFWPN